MGHLDVARSYYDALDEGDYDALLVLLAPSFEQTRPDRSFHSRSTFIDFMREHRPNTDTTHELDAIYRNGETGELAVRGRVCTVNGADLFGFVDVFEFEDGQIATLRTYSD